MTFRGLPALLAGAIALAGCGGSAARRSPAIVHVDGKRAQGDYVSETAASGARFLVPTSTLAAQGSRTFEIAVSSAPTAGRPGHVTTADTRAYRWGVASATAVVPHSAHVEVLATGDAGHRFKLSWEGTCGLTRDGGASGGAGQGIEILRTPAVMLVKLPRVNAGGPSCYLATAAATTSFTRHLRLTIIDY